MQWILTYPAWTIALTAVLAAVITCFFYQSSVRKFDVSKVWVFLMALLRWSTLFLLGLLLLNPLLKYVTNEKIDPVIIVLEDQTASVKEGMKESDLKSYQSAMENTLKDLSGQFKIVKYAFGTELLDSLDEKQHYRQVGTDIDKAIYQAAQRNFGQHIGAVIVSSDGIYNHGMNPVYNSSFSGVPLYTVALGDTTTQTDVRIQRLRYNDLVYLGDELQVLADIAAENLNQQTVQVQLKNAAGQILQQIPVQIKGNEWNETIEFKIKAEQPGIHKYQVTVTQLNQEKTFTNNRQDFYIQVIDGRQKIVLLYDAPHPDIRFISDALGEMKNIEVKTEQIDLFQGKTSDIDLLILHGLPSLRNRTINSKFQSLVQQSASIWWILTTQTDLTGFNQMQNLVQLSNVQRTPNDVVPIFQPAYQKFFVSEEALQWLDKVPPLVAPYGQYQMAANGEVCWTQKLGAVKTSQPLLITGEENQKKTAVLFGEGVWRWGMQEYLQYEQKSRSFEWVERLVQFVANKTDHRPFRIRTGKSIYNESEWISAEAALYNESAQMINPSDVKVILKSDAGYRAEFLMDKTQQAYTYNIGKLPAGAYVLEGTTEWNNKKLKAEYKFAVQSFDLESGNTKADFALLNTLALNHQGQMVHSSELNNLADIIKNDERVRPVYKEISGTKSFIDIKLILLLIVVFLTLEWFLRRFFGQY